MKDLLSLLGYSAGTVLVYLGIRRLSLRFNHPLLNVVALSAGVIIGLLVACDIPYAAYVPAKDAMKAKVRQAGPLAGFCHFF